MDKIKFELPTPVEFAKRALEGAGIRRGEPVPYDTAMTMISALFTHYDRENKALSAAIQDWNNTLPPAPIVVKREDEC
jgi:hypothetical protein